MQAIPSAPQGDQPALRALARLHGVSSIDRDAAFFFAAGALPTGSAAALRGVMLGACAELMQGQGAALLRLCEGFNIPDHCLQAPIAFDWRHI